MRTWNLLSVISPMNLAKFSPPPYSVSSDLGKLDARRHLSSGIDWAMAGAASVVEAAIAAPPTPALRRNLRRCMVSLPGRAFVCRALIPLSGTNLPRAGAVWKGQDKEKAPPRRGFSIQCAGRKLELVGCRLAGHEVVERVL